MNIATMLVVDDHHSSRRAFCDWLQMHEYPNLIEADSYEGALKAAQQEHVALAVIDIKIPLEAHAPISEVENWQNLGFNLARELRKNQPRMAVIFVSTDNELGNEVKALIRELDRHSMAYIAKSSEMNVFIEGIEQARAGKIYIDKAIGYSSYTPVARAFLQTVPETERYWVELGYTFIGNLSKRELEVAHLAVLYPHAYIIEKLNFGQSTLETHMAHIYAKLFGDKSSRSGLVASIDALLAHVITLHKLVQQSKTNK